MVIGIDDDRTIRGPADAFAVEECLASILSDSIEPLVRPGIAIAQISDRPVIVIEVYPSQLIPHHVRRIGPEKGTFVRVGSTNRVADAPLRAELSGLGRGFAYDETPMPDLSSDSLDLEAIRGAFASDPSRPVRRFCTHQARAASNL